MKRLFAVVLAAMLLLCGCAGGSGTPIVGSYKYNYYIAGGAEGETCYALAAALVDFENKNYEDVNLLQRTGADDASSIAAVNSGDVELAAVRSDSLADAADTAKIKALASLYDMNVQMIAKADGGISSLQDLAGKKVAVACAADKALLGKILKAAGAGDANAVEYKSEELIEKVTSGGADAALVLGSDLRGEIESKMSSIAFVPMDAAITALTAEGTGLAEAHMPVGEYRGLENEYNTVAVRAVFIGSASLPEEAVYYMIKTIYDGKTQFISVFKNAEGIDVGDGGRAVSLGFHKGAVKYFAEKQVQLSE